MTMIVVAHLLCLLEVTSDFVFILKKKPPIKMNFNRCRNRSNYEDHIYLRNSSTKQVTVHDAN